MLTRDLTAVDNLLVLNFVILETRTLASFHSV